MRWRWIIAILWLPWVGEGGVLESLHPGLAGTKKELSAVRERLRVLPQLAFTATSARLGFHTETMNAADERVMVQVDLGGTYPLEQIALVPVGVPSGQGGADAYGFPSRVRVSASLTPLGEGTQVGEWSARGGRYPVLIELEKSLARYVRVEIDRHWPLAGQWISALGEIMVFSGGRNVALQRPVELVQGRLVRVPPAWDIANLTDGESLLGPPVSGETSPNRGFRSRDTNAEPWVQVDLGRSRRVDEIRLVPARFAAEADTPGFGFPDRFKILAGYDASFGEHQVLFEQVEKRNSSRGDNPFVLRLDGRQFRFVRVAVQEPWKRGAVSEFALSELQIFSGEENVALHAESQASGEDQETWDWGRLFLTDGYSSRFRLIPRIDQLKLLAERQELERRAEELEELQQRQLSQALAAVTYGGAAVVLVLGFSVAGLRVRQRRLAHRATQALRAQIASDLHDDVGSNLGSIALLAQSAGTGDLKKKLSEIDETARETAESMRDIVWLLQAGISNSSELLRQMRGVAERGENVDFSQRNEGERKLPLEFTRQVFLIFKEALANARKHSGAGRIDVEAVITKELLSLEVSDDGDGFDPSAPVSGNGLGNLRDRAGALGANLVIESAPGKGTRVRLSAPLPRS